MNNIVNIITIIFGAVLLILNLKDLLTAFIEKLLEFYIKRELKITKTINKQLSEILDNISHDSECVVKKISDLIKIKHTSETKGEYSYPNKMQYSIVEELYNKKTKQYNYAVIPLLFGAILYCFIDIFFDMNTNMELMIFLDIFICFVLISRGLIVYRIKHGYYGTNYEEAKELLYYLIQDNDNNDKNIGKKLFTEIDNYNVEKSVEPVTNGELQY